MEKQYRVVVPFGGHKVGDILLSGIGYGEADWVGVKIREDAATYNVPLKIISDKVEEVKPLALRKWLVEEVATREEATDAEHTNKTYASGDGLYVSRSWVEKLGDSFVWVKITEQKEEERWVPKVGDKYWGTSHGIDSVNSYPDDFTWEGCSYDLGWLEEGDVFKTREECQAYIDSKKKAA